MEYIFIYLLQFFETIEAIKILTGGCLIIGGLFYLCGKCQYMADEKYYQELKTIYNKILDKVFIGFLTVFLITLFIPTKDTLLLIGGTYYGKKAVKAIITDKKLEKVNTIIELELDKRIKELQNDN